MKLSKKDLAEITRNLPTYGLMQFNKETKEWEPVYTYKKYTGAYLNKHFYDEEFEHAREGLIHLGTIDNKKNYTVAMGIMEVNHVKRLRKASKSNNVKEAVNNYMVLADKEYRRWIEYTSNSSNK